MVKYLQPQVGIVVRINQRTATVDTGNRHSWRVPFHMLRHVFDICVFGRGQEAMR
ncbi:hypothetical protein [Variovorax sp. LT1R16]|uniref:hypothetical protein n=1 Tax=Variovorax sp. LT1R16 TaxID=3443728 RepID=UPI003F48AB3A